MTKNDSNLLVIYLDSSLSPKIVNELENSFQIKIVRKTKRISFLNYKEEGNRLISSYNHILFSTNSKIVFFICASELKDTTSLLNFNSNVNFGFFKKPSNKLAEFLSGFFVKKEVLMRIGCFDRYTFNNLYLNFLINYFRFYHTIPEDNFFEPLMKINSTNLVRYNFWSLFEDSFYQNQILYKDSYQTIKNKIHSLPKTIVFASLLIDKFVRKNTSRWYW